MSNERNERIRERAHAIWEREGRPEGRDSQHWQQAVAEVDEEDAQAVEANEALNAKAGKGKTTGRRKRPAGDEGGEAAEGVAALTSRLGSAKTAKRAASAEEEAPDVAAEGEPKKRRSPKS